MYTRNKKRYKAKKRWLIFDPDNQTTIAAVHADTKERAAHRLTRMWQELHPEDITPENFEDEVNRVLEFYYIVPSESAIPITLFD